jgi:GH24 family phage-related lysozyme (muramidase)
MIKLLCKPVRTLVSWLYGIAAGAIVRSIWASAARGQDGAKAAGAPQEWRKAA